MGPGSIRPRQAQPLGLHLSYLTHVLSLVMRGFRHDEGDTWSTLLALP
jgi:hypothetical protein